MNANIELLFLWLFGLQSWLNCTHISLHKHIITSIVLQYMNFNYNLLSRPVQMHVIVNFLTLFSSLKHNGNIATEMNSKTTAKVISVCTAINHATNTTNTPVQDPSQWHAHTTVQFLFIIVIIDVDREDIFVSPLLCTSFHLINEHT